MKIFNTHRIDYFMIENNYQNDYDARRFFLQMMELYLYDEY